MKGISHVGKGILVGPRVGDISMRRGANASAMEWSKLVGGPIRH